MIDFQLVQHPVIQRTVYFKFQGADRVRDAFNGIRQTVGKVIHGINAPHASGAVMRHMLDTVQGRVPQNNIGGGHVDFGPQYMLAVLEFAGPHALEQIQILRDGALSIGAVFARTG